MSKERGAFIDTIQGWFYKRSNLWAVLSFFTFAYLIILQASFVSRTEINSQINQGIHSLMIPFLILFVFSIFWRSSTTTFLSLAGALNLYVGMFYIYTKDVGLQTLVPHVANRLGYGKVLTSPSASSIGNFYFLIGMFALVLCIMIAFKPSLFKAKGTQIRPSYPIWSNKHDPKLAFGAKAISLIPVLGLLSVTEHHLVAKYKYIQVMIGGTTYYVSPDDWVPENSRVIRDKESGSLLGIPKVPDGFSIW